MCWAAARKLPQAGRYKETATSPSTADAQMAVTVQEHLQPQAGALTSREAQALLGKVRCKYARQASAARELPLAQQTPQRPPQPCWCSLCCKETAARPASAGTDTELHIPRTTNLDSRSSSRDTMLCWQDTNLMLCPTELLVPEAGSARHNGAAARTVSTKAATQATDRH